MRLNCEVYEQFIRGLAPDAIILATGSLVAKPPIPGIDNEKFLTVADILDGKVLPGRNVLIAGGGLRRSGVADAVKKSLAEHGVDCVDFEKVKSDPPASLVDEGADFARENGCDCVIAIGGGSAIDMGKAINMLRFNEGKVLEYLSKPHVHSPGLFCRSHYFRHRCRTLHRLCYHRHRAQHEAPAAGV